MTERIIYAVHRSDPDVVYAFRDGRIDGQDIRYTAWRQYNRRDFQPRDSEYGRRWQEDRYGRVSLHCHTIINGPEDDNPGNASRHAVFATCEHRQRYRVSGWMTWEAAQETWNRMQSARDAGRRQMLRMTDSFSCPVGSFCVRSEEDPDWNTAEPAPVQGHH